MDLETVTRAGISQALSELARLVDYLAGLNETGWQNQSACEGWTVRDVIDHRGSGLLYQIQDGQAGSQPKILQLGQLFKAI